MSSTSASTSAAASIRQPPLENAILQRLLLLLQPRQQVRLLRLLQHNPLLSLRVQGSLVAVICRLDHLEQLRLQRIKLGDGRVNGGRC